MNFNHSFVPLKLAEAQSFVAEHHRHSKPLKRHRFSIGVKTELGIKGIATVDNCSSSWANRHDHMEIRRVCTDGTKNLASRELGAVLVNWQPIIVNWKPSDLTPIKYDN